MTNENAQTDAQTEQTAHNDTWPQRFGTMEKMVVKTSQKTGRQFAVVTIDCKAFKQVAMVFKSEALEVLKNAGVGARVWVKGPMETVEKTNAKGNTYEETIFKVIYAKDNSEDTGGAHDESAAEEVEPDDFTLIAGVGPKIDEAFKAAGIRTYKDLVAADDESLENAGTGFAARANTGKWLAQAAALLETGGVSTKSAEDAAAEVPF